MVLVFGGAGLVLAYFLGFYDIAFLDRAKLLSAIATPTHTAADTVDTGSLLPADTDTAAVDTAIDTADISDEDDPTGEDELPENVPTGNQSGSSPIAGNQMTTVQTPQKQAKSVCHVVDPALLSDNVKSYSTIKSLTDKGYSFTTGDWQNGTTKLAKMRFTYALPKDYSVSDRTVSKLSYVYPENFTEYYAAYTDVTEARPAIELYMGYILYDNGKQIVLIDHDGNILQGLDDTVTVPAYERDKNGLPLFYRLSWVDGAYEKVYYRLSDDGKSFVLSDYDPVLDSRGLTFDYPASYGTPDTTAPIRVQEGKEAVTARLEAEATRIAALTAEERQAEEERLKREKAVLFNAYENARVGYTINGVELTGYKFRQAFGFRNGYAAVVGDENRQELYFIGTNGRKALSGYKNYLKQDYERYVIESWRLPASYGIESIGSLYFDHGWVRVRRQIIDNWAYTMYNNEYVISDTEILINATGEEFPIPSGYNLQGYSCGMLLLEKDGKYGFMDYTGAWIAQPVYQSATPFVSGLATLTTPDGRVGMIDTEGNIVLAFAYEAVTPCSSGLVAAYHEETGWAVYQVVGK